MLKIKDLTPNLPATSLSPARWLHPGIVPEKIRHREDAHNRLFLGHRQMPDAVVLHQFDRLDNGLVVVDRDDRLVHTAIHRRGRRIKSLNNDGSAEHRLRNRAHVALVVIHEQEPDLVFFHTLSGVF